MPFAAIQMQPEIIILSGVRKKYHMILSIHRIQNMTQVNLPIKQKQNHGHREQLLVAKRDEAGEGWSGRSGLADRVSIYRMDKQQGPTIYTEDYIQPPVINHNGNNRKKNVHVCTPDSLCCTVLEFQRSIGMWTNIVVQLLSHVQVFVTRGLQHTRLLCPPLSPRICSNSCPFSG